MSVDPATSIAERVVGLFACASLLVLVVCGGGVPIPAYVQQPSGALAQVAFPPPPARAEFVPHQPATAAVWIDGEWVWRRRRWAWRLGRWVVPPGGARFSPWTMVRADDGALYYASGAWRDAKGQEVTEPKALATATSSAGEVVNSEGETENTGRTFRAGPRDAPLSGPPRGDGGAAP